MYQTMTSTGNELERRVRWGAKKKLELALRHTLALRRLLFRRIGSVLQATRSRDRRCIIAPLIEEAAAAI